VKRWFSDPLFRRTLLLALVLGALDGAAAMLTGWPRPWHDGVNTACGILVGAAAMRLWTWKGKP
jgi:hypothetical protein